MESIRKNECYDMDPLFLDGEKNKKAWTIHTPLGTHHDGVDFIHRVDGHHYVCKGGDEWIKKECLLDERYKCVSDLFKHPWFRIEQLHGTMTYLYYSIRYRSTKKEYNRLLDIMQRLT